MDKATLEQIKEIHKNSIFNNTLYSYASAITGIFLAQPSKITETCDILGLTEEELIDILKAPTFATMSLLDEMVDLNTKKVLSDDTVKRR